MKIKLKDEDGKEHIVECGHYTYDVDHKALHLYDSTKEDRKLIGVYNNIKWFNKEE